MSGDETPIDFSIVVPTHERAESLGACLESLCAIDYRRDRFEVIVVDDGSSAPPRQLVESFANRISVRFVGAVHAGPAAARNVGADAARGAALAFIADDCTADRGWLRELAEHFEQHPHAAVSGRVLNSARQSRCAEAAQLLNEYLAGYFNSTTEGIRFCTPNNLTVPATAFRAVGGFDPAFAFAGEDRDFCARWQESGQRIAYRAGAVVRHLHPLRLGQFLRQQFSYGRGSLRYRRRLASRRGTALRFERPGFYLGLVTYPVRSHGIGGALPALLIVAAQLMIGLGAGAELCASFLPSRSAPATRPRAAAHRPK